MAELIQEFYHQFHCVADQCSFTCCQEWEIAIDSDTYQVWKKKAYSCTGRKLNSYTKKENGRRQVKLLENQKCPFLREDRLCQLVMDYGDEILSQTCATFPRQSHVFSNRVEHSVVSCCPEVIDYFAAADTVNFQQKEELAWSEEATDEEKLLFDIREEMMRVLSDKRYSVSEALKMLSFILLDIEEKYYADEAWCYQREDYFSEGMLQELKKAIAEVSGDSLATMQERNALFLDISVNYMEKGLYLPVLAPLYEQALSLEKAMKENTFCATDSVLFVYEQEKLENIMRNFLVSELFTNLVKPQSDMESITVMLQWIALEYAMMQHALYLQCLCEKEDELSYEKVRSILVLLSRMMGYDEDDIFEYLENAFEDLLWPWNYFALIIGG